MTKLKFVCVVAAALTAGYVLAAPASFNPASGTVQIPELAVSGDASGARYAVTMQQSGASSFNVTGVQPFNATEGATPDPAQHRVVAEPFTLTYTQATSPSRDVFAICPQGMYATGGGFYKDGPSNLVVYPVRSQPDITVSEIAGGEVVASGWWVTLSRDDNLGNLQSVNIHGQVYAICTKL